MYAVQQAHHPNLLWTATLFDELDLLTSYLLDCVSLLDCFSGMWYTSSVQKIGGD